MASMRATVLVGLAVALGIAAVPTAAGTGRPAWIELFDGRSTAGWRMSGPGSFTVEGGALVAHGGMGLLWYERRRFRDFELQVDWRVGDRCDNSGIFVRFPDRPRSPSDAVVGGYEVQIDDCDPDGLRQQTGSIYDVAPARRLVSRPAGTWNRYLIRVVGQRYTVFLNGARVTELAGSRARVGYIGLQNHDPDSRVEFRRVRVRPLVPGP
jgi:hypothetical protein